MAISELKSSVVDPGATPVSLSQIFSATAGSSDPTYLVLNALDRNEYTAGESGAVGSFNGNGHTLSLGSIGSDGRGAGIVFTYQASSGRYYNSTYGYLDQMTYTTSTGLADVTNLSLFGTSSVSTAIADASNAYGLMQYYASGYLGSATLITQPHYTAAIPAQATPDGIATVADSFVGQAWNMDGCWLLASTIAAESGASLPVQSTAIGVAGVTNGEWIVAFNGPGGQTANWESLVRTGDIIAFETASGGGHITTCVSGYGGSALLVDNITYENGLGQITNAANDGSANDVLVVSPHLASQEWSGVQQSTVVIYRLDTPVVSSSMTFDSLASTTSQSLTSLFSAADPSGKAVTRWQIYNTATSDSLVLNGTSYQDHSAATALTESSLSGISLQTGATAAADAVEVRAYNGSYWGDWYTLSVAVTPAVVLPPPVVNVATASQTWLAGKAVSLTLPSNTFLDPDNPNLTYKATLAGGAALPAWLSFNTNTETFSGTTPPTAQVLSIAVTATNANGKSVSETFSAAILAAPVVNAVTPTQSWVEGKAVSLALPSNAFTDPQGQKLTYKATLGNGAALPSWLTFSGGTLTFSGTAPSTAQTLSVTVIATDSSGLSASETFAVHVQAAPILASRTATQTWVEGKTLTLALASTTFTDPQKQTLTYKATLAGGDALPGWLKFNGVTDTFSGTAPTSPQTLSLTVTATDSGGLSVSETFTANVLGTPILVSATPNQTWKEGQAVSLALPSGTFTDPQNEKLTLKATLSNGQALPSWLTFNATTGTFSGTTPSTAQSLNITVTATDSSGLSASETFAANVLAPPLLNVQTASQTWVEGKAISFAVPGGTFADPQGEKLTYSAALATGGPLPGWLTFNTTTGTFGGTAPQSGNTLSIKVTATDTGGLSASETFTVNVLGAPVVSSPTATQSWTEGKAISLVLPSKTFTDPQAEKLTFKATLANGSALPGWLRFNAATETFSGTAPSAAQSLSLMVTATDVSGLSVSETFAAGVKAATGSIAAAAPASMGMMLLQAAGVDTHPVAMAGWFPLKLGPGSMAGPAGIEPPVPALGPGAFIGPLEPAMLTLHHT